MALNTPVRIDPTPFLAASRDEIAATLPEPLASLADAIVHSRRILAWPDDWDDEGSPGYDERVWLRAVGFLLSNAVQLWNDRGLAIPALRGAYLYADYLSAAFFALRVQGGAVVMPQVEITASINPDRNVDDITSFGQDNAGELYVVSFNGQVFRIDAQ